LSSNKTIEEDEMSSEDEDADSFQMQLQKLKRSHLGDNSSDEESNYIPLMAKSPENTAENPLFT
jgi:hypothetical protein